MGFGKGIDTHLDLHTGLMRLELLQTVEHILLRLARSTNWGHSLAEAPLHHKAQVVVQGSLGHSPDSLLRGPRLMVVPALGAGEPVRQVAVWIGVRWLYVCGLGLGM